MPTKSKSSFQRKLEQLSRQIANAAMNARDYFSTMVDITTGAAQRNERKNFLRAYRQFQKDKPPVPSSFNEFANAMRKQLKSRLYPTTAPGRMFFFMYDPKTKDELPYYDQLPLIIYLQPKPGKDEAGRDVPGFLGLNLHYLPPRNRAMLLDALYDNYLNKRRNDKQKIDFNYQIMVRAARSRLYKNCIKHYLLPKVRSRFLSVPVEQWHHAIFLPFERFVKADKRTVWRDSLRQ